MTIVRVKVQNPTDGPPVPASGSIRWAPTARRIIPGEGGEPSTIVLPSEFPAPLVGGAVDVEVEPAVWSVVEQFAGHPSRRRHFAIPDQESVDYADLIEIDPITLDPAINVTPDPDNPGFYLIGA